MLALLDQQVLPVLQAHKVLLVQEQQVQWELQVQLVQLAP
jgi:hypothetical protein